MFRALFFSSLTCLVCFIGCATKPILGNREPAGVAQTKQLAKEGEQCELDLHGDATLDRAVIGSLFGKRVLMIMHPENAGKKAQYHVEELSNDQTVGCVVNEEPGVSFAGTDENQKGISVPLRGDYIKINTPEKDARFLYYDASFLGFKTVWRAN